LAAAACCCAIGIAPAAIVAGLESFRPLPGRLVRHARADSVVVIDDSYNANPDSVRAAIDLLAGLRQREQAGRVVLVLGDMGEVGAQGPEFHAEVGAWAQHQGLDALIATGALASAAVRGWQSAEQAGAQFCSTIDEAIVAARVAATPGTTLLVKGSRFMRMERVVRGLLEPAVAAQVGGHA
jgi:UDP-N-acetylmuramoyl-tripeptide--D-alanyl-D-alanine ligase